MKTKTLFAVLFLIAASLAAAQTNQTFTYEGDGCNGVYGCEISPAMDIMAPWGATAPVNGGTPSAKYTVMTGLNVSLSGYRSFAAIPEHLASNGTGTFNWFDGVGGSGSFTLPVACTWDYTPIANPIQPNNPIREFTEVCTSVTDPQGEMATFTRHWQATEGRYGYWNISRFVLGNLGANSIVDTSTLIDSSTVAILDAPTHAFLEEPVIEEPIIVN